MRNACTALRIGMPAHPARRLPEPLLYICEDVPAQRSQRQRRVYNAIRIMRGHPKARPTCTFRKAVIDMWCKKVLVAYDGSAASHKALDLANSIAEEEPEARFVFVHVMKLYAMGTGAETVLIEDANAAFDELKEFAAPLGERAEVKLLRGSAPAELILRCAKDEGCDLIVMGSRGRGGVKGYLGSVSYAVVQGSPIAVLITKEEA